MAGLFLLNNWLRRSVHDPSTWYDCPKGTSREIHQMHPPVAKSQLLILGTAALVGAAWFYIKKEDLQHTLNFGETARSTDAQATSEPADRVKDTTTEQLIAEVGAALAEAQRARDAAELTLKQAREQLVMEKEDIDTGPRKKKPTRTESTRRRHSRR
jgi:hypothetical protein